MTALIFDCDGVLVDSEPIAVAELGVTLRAAGVPISDAQIYRRIVGHAMASVIAMIRAEYGIDITAHLPGYRARLEARFAAELRPMAGIRAAIATLDGMPRAVASSSAPARLMHSLTVTGLVGLFGDHIYSATQVAHGKPAPDLFLMAAARLAIPARDCIVIEDSEAGIRAAQAAGMRCIGFTGGSHAAAGGLAERLPALRPDAMAASAEALPEIIARLIAAR